ncbi:MAG TPA: neutral zinc metallopeptidase, partial [Gemmatales bacterium]|nr:neutral zinc metallopeptidase [Gemmatales bacterium]
MRWEDREKSTNVEDRRRLSPQAGMALGGGGIIILIIALIFGLDPRKVANVIGQVQGNGAGQGQVDPNIQFTPEQERQADFSKVVFGDTERIWTELFRKELV